MRLKAIILFTIALAVFLSCSNLTKVQKQGGPEKGIELSEQKSDSTEFEIIVIDPGFESWFVKNRKQPWYHTKEILEVKNWQYVIAWNQKVMDGRFQMLNPRNPFEQQIDYDRNTDYGMDVNYKLYYYFKYIEDTWGKFSL